MYGQLKRAVQPLSVAYDIDPNRNCDNIKRCSYYCRIHKMNSRLAARDRLNNTDIHQF